jgi:hypothetical protein
MKRPEQSLQRGVVRYLTLMENMGKLTYFHVPNGGKRSKVEAAIFKSLGVRAGVSDLVLLFPDARSAFIELKAPGGKLTDAQKRFRCKVEGLGFPFAVCDAVDEVERFVRAILNRATC